jgi:hypothetical protein
VWVLAGPYGGVRFICLLLVEKCPQRRSATPLGNLSLKSRTFEATELGSALEMTVGAANIEDATVAR